MNRKLLLNKILSLMDEQMPHLNKKAFVSDELAKAIFGAIPSYSPRKTYHILPVNTATLSGFVICHYQNQIVLIRKRPFSYKTRFLGFLGGFVNIDKNTRETPQQAAVREFGEECCDEKARPLINFSPDRLKIINVYMDYTKIELDLTPTLNVAYRLELTADEFSKINEHAAKLRADTTYATQIYNASNHEVFAFEILPVTDLLQRKSDFAHKNEFAALQEFYQNH
ncbi:MAG: NUDIX hydrolase [Alphaproteobacteria bacterium]|nr:NUDIX hydrolase [Alphaproteobacteria bacterium]